MAHIRKLDQIRPIISCSSSIANWREKILKRYVAQDYDWHHLRRDVTFFGLYRPKDFLRVLLHRGRRTIHWQGSDILGAGWHYRWLQKIEARHVCENEIEQGILRLMLQQEIEIVATFLSDPNEFKVCYEQSDRPNVWCHINRNAELESGWKIIEQISKKTPEITYHIYGKSNIKSEANIINHGFVPEKQFNQEIKDYQAGLRLHEFDGMSEVIFKSVLLGQYPISRIRYPYIDTYRDEAELIKLLQDLKNKKQANYQARDYYAQLFTLR